MDNVMVIGSGGREHALAWKLAQSPHVGTVYVAPGNGGTATERKCVNVPELRYSTVNIPALADFAQEKSVALTIVGPEQPLIDGIADYFSFRNLRLFGPSKEGAMLEGDKFYSKHFMKSHKIPTATFLAADSYKGAMQAIDILGYPVYIKVSGLAAGKGALPGRTEEEAREAMERIMINREFGDAGKIVVVEKLLEGEETSCMALVNSLAGISVPFLPSQDHKKLLDEDKGPNTGGMGAYAPTSIVIPEIQQQINTKVLDRTNKGLRDYKGFLYPGLMITREGPMVLEYNVRMGDPETQPLMRLLKSDLYEAIQDTLDGRAPKLEWHEDYAITVTLAAPGYPDNPRNGMPVEIPLLDSAVKIFHGGTSYSDKKLIATGGRVLYPTVRGKTIEEARDRVYNAIHRIHFDGMQFRSDIGMREVMRK